MPVIPPALARSLPRRHHPLLALACFCSIPLAFQDSGEGVLGVDAESEGPVRIEADGAPVLAYQAHRVALPAGFLAKIAEGNRIYAKPRSGYIHPLHGLDGEELTLDWSTDHPHHRGIYWAWPEVKFGETTGDLHALQHVYSRPVGEPALARTEQHARVEAHNLWLWHDEQPVVFERVAITAWSPAADGSRRIDLDLQFEALADGVSLARRDTNLYGGLNVRLAPVAGLKFDHHSQEATQAAPARAWSATTGTWKGGKRVTTLAILEHPTNPDFPGDFITYEELPWFQPTFPRADTRYGLVRGKPLTLRYRFLILAGEADPKALAAACDAYAATELLPLQGESTPSKQ